MAGREDGKKTKYCVISPSGTLCGKAFFIILLFFVSSTTGCIFDDDEREEDENDNNIILIAPTSLDLLSEYDAGVSPRDNITNRNEMTIQGIALAGTLVELWNGPTRLSQVQPDENGIFSCEITLSEGVHELYAVATYGVNISHPSEALKITVDTTPPSISVVDVVDSSHVRVECGESLEVLTSRFPTISPGAVNAWKLESENIVSITTSYFLLNERYLLDLDNVGDMAGNSLGNVDFTLTVEDYYGVSPDMNDVALKKQLLDVIGDHYNLDYSVARDVMYSDIDNVDGRVRCVYTGHWITTDDVPPPNQMNTEHTWPQSQGTKNEPAKSDLHHIFPTVTEANTKRSDHKFGDVVHASWSSDYADDEGQECKLGDDDKGYEVFEPRTDHLGDAARAIFYISIRYELTISRDYEIILRQWHQQDPPSSTELERNLNIEKYQHNRNPFVDWAELVDRIDDF